MVLFILRAVLWVRCQQMRPHLAVSLETHILTGGNAEHSTAAVPTWLAFFSHTLVHISHQVYGKNNSGAKGKSLNISISMPTCGLLSMN